MIFQQIRNATSIITFAGKKFLLDPFLADQGALPPVPSPLNAAPNPLVPLPLPIDVIVAVDAVVVTHMHHFDHFDEAARKAVARDIPVFVQSEKEALDMRAMGFTAVTALTEAGVGFGGITLYRTDALHGWGEAVARKYRERGIPAEACGVVFVAPGEKTLYAAGDTVWYAGVRAALDRYRPDVVVLNAADARFCDETPILMGADGLYEAAMAAPQATIIASHLDAVNHARLGRAGLREFVQARELSERVRIPEDGEICTFYARPL